MFDKFMNYRDITKKYKLIDDVSKTSWNERKNAENRFKYVLLTRC